MSNDHDRQPGHENDHSASEPAQPDVTPPSNGHAVPHQEAAHDQLIVEEIDVGQDIFVPVEPGSGWLDNAVDDRIGGMPSPASGVEPSLVGENSDLFSRNPTERLESSDNSDVLTSTAHVTPSPAGQPNRHSDVAITFDHPSGGRKPGTPGGSSDLPVAEDIPDPTDALFTPDIVDTPFDSAKLFDLPDFEPNAESTQEFDYGGSILPTGESSGIIGDNIILSDSALVDPASIMRKNNQSQQPGFDLTIGNELPGELLDQPSSGGMADPWSAAADSSGQNIHSEKATKDWKQQSGSDLFSDARTKGKKEFGLSAPGDDDVDPFIDGLIPDEPSLSSSESSIFTGEQLILPQGISGISGASLNNPEESDSVEFSDHPEHLGSGPETGTLKAPPGWVDFDKIDEVNESEYTMRSPLPSGLADNAHAWLSSENAGDSNSEEENLDLSGTSEWAEEPSELFQDKTVQRNPRDSSSGDISLDHLFEADTNLETTAKKGKKKEDGSFEVDFLADSTESPAIKMVKSGPKPALRTGKKKPPSRTHKALASRSDERTEGSRHSTGRLVGVGIFGLLLAVGAYFLGASSSDSRPNTVARVEPNKMPITPAHGEEPKPVPTIAGAQTALDSGDPARALAMIEASGVKTAEARAALGQARLFSRLRDLPPNAPVAANDAVIEEARSDLKAAIDDAALANSPIAAKAALHLGLTFELSGDRTTAKSTYEDGIKKFPGLANIFQAALDRLGVINADGNKVSQLKPHEFEELAASTVILFLLAEPDAAAEPIESGIAFWRAANAAASKKFDIAMEQIAIAKSAHQNRARSLSGRGLNPLTDPLEQIFPRCCDELRSFWELKKTFQDYPGVGSIGDRLAVVKILDQAKSAGELKNRAESLTLELNKAKEKYSATEGDLTSAKEQIVKFEKALQADKEKVDSLEKVLKETRETATDLSEQAKKAESNFATSDKSRKESEATLASIASSLQEKKLLGAKFTTPELLEASRIAASRATGPDLTKLIPPELAGVAGTGLTTGHLLELAARVRKAEATATAAETANAQLKKEQVVALKVLEAEAIANRKKLADEQVVALEKLKAKQDAEREKLIAVHASEVKSLAEAIAAEKARLVAAEKRFQADLGNSLSPSRAVDLWLAILVELRRASDAAPALEAAEKLLRTAAPESEDAAKANSVSGLALLLMGDKGAAKLKFRAALDSPAFKLANNKDWAKAADVGMASLDDSAAPARIVMDKTPKKDSAIAGRLLDQGIKAYRGGRYVEAEKQLADAAWNDQTNPITWYFLGATHWALGKNELARDDFQQGSKHELARTVSARAIDAAIEPIQGPARDALTASRP